MSATGRAHADRQFGRALRCYTDGERPPALTASRSFCPLLSALDPMSRGTPWPSDSVRMTQLATDAPNPFAVGHNWSFRGLPNA